MASVDLDLPPVYDIATQKGDLFSGIYQQWLATFVQTLIGYLTSNGIFLPQLTTVQRDANIPTPVNGQMIFNTTVGMPQVWYAGVWNNF